MKTLTDHKTNDANSTLNVLALDEPGSGGAHHVYQITGYTPQPDAGREAYTAYNEACGGLSFRGEPLPSWDQLKADPKTEKLVHYWNTAAMHTAIRFQNGPIQESGINGVTQEALLAIVRDRLRCFQAGPFACRENAIALTKLDEAAMWLEERTKARTRRGVEGTHKL